VAELTSDPLVEFAGTLGPSQNGLNPGAYRWKMFNTFGYGIDRWSASLQWQHLPSVKSATYPANHATRLVGASSYDLFNLSGSFAFTKDAVIRLGIENVLDKEPPLMERNSAPPPGVLAGGTFGGECSAPRLRLNGRRFTSERPYRSAEPANGTLLRKVPLARLWRNGLQRPCCSQGERAHGKAIGVMLARLLALAAARAALKEPRRRCGDGAARIDQARPDGGQTPTTGSPTAAPTLSSARAYRSRTTTRPAGLPGWWS
jgi:hypothetical protein